MAKEQKSQRTTKPDSASELQSFRASELAAPWARRGQSIVEILVAIAIGALLVIAAAGIIAPALRANTAAGRAQVAAALAKELGDNIRVWSEGDWHNVLNLATSSTNTYYLNTTSSPFTAATGTESVVVATTTYTRSFYIDDVQRDSGGTIVSSGGSNDPSTKKITEGYNWPQGVTTTFSFYISRYRNNVFDQTDWSGGSGQGTPVTSTKNSFASSTSITFLTPGSIKITLSSSTVYSCNGPLGSWATTTPLPSPIANQGVVVYNNFVYSIGGSGTSSATSTVNYASINSSGTLGGWASTTALPIAVSQQPSVVSSSYIYLLTSGEDNAVYYTYINGNGTLGSWATTTPMLTRNIIQDPGVVNNSYVYQIGGTVSSTATSTVSYAPITSTSSLGAWTTTTALPISTSTLNHAAVAYNGYVYSLGGGSNGAGTSSVNYAQINANGTLGSWASTTPLTSFTYQNAAVVSNGYIYSIGGSGVDHDLGTSSVNYVYVNSSGTLGSWSAASALPSPIFEHGAVVNNGYVYTIGGSNNGIAGITSTVFYASCR